MHIEFYYIERDYGIILYREYIEMCSDTLQFSYEDCSDFFSYLIDNDLRSKFSEFSQEFQQSLVKSLFIDPNILYPQQSIEHKLLERRVSKDYYESISKLVNVTHNPTRHFLRYAIEKEKEIDFINPVVIAFSLVYGYRVLDNDRDESVLNFPEFNLKPESTNEEDTRFSNVNCLRDFLALDAHQLIPLEWRFTQNTNSILYSKIKGFPDSNEKSNERLLKMNSQRGGISKIVDSWREFYKTGIFDKKQSMVVLAQLIAYGAVDLQELAIQLERL